MLPQRAVCRALDLVGAAFHTCRTVRELELSRTSLHLTRRGGGRVCGRWGGVGRGGGCYLVLYMIDQAVLIIAVRFPVKHE